MMLHFEDLDAPVLQPHERDPSRPTALAFSVPIPTYDATDVPTYVHVVPGSLIIVVTVVGLLHAFSLEGQLLQTSQLQSAPRGSPLTCFSSTGVEGPGSLYILAGGTVIRVAAR